MSYSLRVGKHFCARTEDTSDGPRSGRLLSQLTDENIEPVRQIINNDSHSTYDEIVAESSFSHGAIQSIIYDY